MTDIMIKYKQYIRTEINKTTYPYSCQFWLLPATFVHLGVNADFACQDWTYQHER